MAKNEAKVIFTANVTQFNSAIKQAEGNLKGLRAELRLNGTELKGTGDKTELLKSRLSLLTTELVESQKKTDAIKEKLQEAEKVFGKNSKEVQTLTKQLADAKNVEASIENDINNTSQNLKKQNDVLKQSNPAWKSNMDAVEKNKTTLNSLDKELELNSAKMQGVSDKTKLLKERKELLAKQYKVTSDNVKQFETALDQCGREVGENSEEYSKLKEKLHEAKIEQANVQAEIKKTSDTLKTEKTELHQFGDKVVEGSKKITDVGKKMSVVSGAVAGVGFMAGKSAVEFESAFAGVKKTVDEVYDANGTLIYSYKDLENGIRDMAKEIPASATEISHVAEAAGQLGIKTQDILGFTKVMIDLGNSTNLAAEDAATSIAKFSNITGLAADETMTAEEKYGKLGSVLVDLGNHYATTERDIMDMAMNLASAGTQVGMSESDILALAAALSSVGLESEAGGTAFSKTMIKMQLAVETQSESLKDWANVAGMSVEEFTRLFQEDATGALEAFIKGLSAAGGEGGSAIKILDDMGIKETRMRDALLRSANASDVFSDAIKVGSDAWKENAALTEEANKRYETTESQLEITKNKIKDIGIGLGKELLPVVNDALDGIQKLTEKFSGLTEGQKKTILAVASIIAVIGPLLMIIGSIGQGIGMLTTAFALMSPPVLIAIAVIAALVGIGWTLYRNWDAIKQKAGELKDWISEKWEGIKTKTSEIWEGIKSTISSAWETIKNVVQVGIMFLGELINFGFQIITLPFQFIWQNCKDIVFNAWENIKTTVSSAWENVKGIFTGAWDSIATVVGPIWTNMKNSVSEKLEGMKTAASEKWEGIRTIAFSKWESIKTTVSSKAENIKTAVSDKWESIKSATSSKWENIKNGIKEKMDSAKTAVKNAIDKIKGFFDFKWKLPDLKVPHFSITGKFNLNPPEVPHFGISWHKKGIVFNRATIMPGIDGMHGFGEAGKEYALPLNRNSLMPLADMLGEMIGNMIMNSIQNLIGIDYDRLERIIEKHSKKENVIKVDKRELIRVLEG